MRLLSAIYVSAILPFAAVAAPLAHAVRDDAIAQVSREDEPSVPAAPTTGDIFEDVGLTPREVDVELDPRYGGSEGTSERNPGSGGCVIA
ncbi:hypothetical protein FB451DRAFT_1565496 [Mycena latifolia]|nr:hypothetical protein FB451DRAFT_1565496 [Mycena latifolia]